MSEIKDSFIKNIFYPLAQKCLEELTFYIHQNKREIIDTFTQTMDCISSKLTNIDLIHTKYIIFSLLRTEILKEGKFLYSTRIFDKTLENYVVLDTDAFYNAYWLTEKFREFSDHLDAHVKQSMIKSYPLLIRELKGQMIKSFNPYLIYMAKISLREYCFLNTTDCKELNVLAGDYIYSSSCLSNTRVELVKDYSLTNNTELAENIGKLTVVDIRKYDFSKVEKYNDISIEFSYIVDCDFSNILIQYGNFRGTVFQNCNLHGITFMNCNLEGTIFKNCELSCSMFYQCFSSFHFDKKMSLYDSIEFFCSNISRAKFRDSQLSGVSFIECLLDDTVFEKSNTEGFNL